MNTSELNALFLGLETSLLEKEVRNNRVTVSSLLADEFIEYGTSGEVYDKIAILDSLAKEETDLHTTVSDLAAMDLSSEVVLVTYKTKTSGDDAIKSALRSSIWIFRDGRWQMLFHQGTKAS